MTVTNKPKTKNAPQKVDYQLEFNLTNCPAWSGLIVSGSALATSPQRLLKSFQVNCGSNILSSEGPKDRLLMAVLLLKYEEEGECPAPSVRLTDL